MLFLAILFLHIVFMFMAVAVAYGGVIFFVIALRTRNTDGVRVMTATAKMTARIIPILFIIGGLFGLTAAIVSSVNLLAPWLVISYVLFGVLGIYGGAITAPSIARIGSAVGTAPGGMLPTEASKMTSRFYVLEVVDFGLLFLFIFDMVVKPFS